MLVTVGVCGKCGGPVGLVIQWWRAPKGEDPFECRNCGPIPLSGAPVFTPPAKKEIDDRNRDLCDARRELSMAQAVVAKAQAKIDKQRMEEK